jgi:hypothetical protein
MEHLVYFFYEWNAISIFGKHIRRSGWTVDHVLCSGKGLEEGRRRSVRLSTTASKNATTASRKRYCGIARELLA